MKTQTKCTLAICGLFIIEILPVPFSAVYSLYAIRKRPDWLPRVVDNLYLDRPAKEGDKPDPYLPIGHDPMALRKKCTITLVGLFVVDLIVPVIIPTALFVVRRRPLWFKHLVAKLYSDKLQPVVLPRDAVMDLKTETPEFQAEMQQKLAELERKNQAFARSLVTRPAHGFKIPKTQ